MRIYESEEHLHNTEEAFQVERIQQLFRRCINGKEAG